MIESAKEEFDSVKEDELIEIMDKLDDDEYFTKLKKDVKETELEKLKSGPAEPAEEEANKNKRRAEEAVPEKEPSKKKTKDNKKKKAAAVGGVSMFGGKDLFGGKNPFASRKQEVSSEEEEEEEEVAASEETKTSPSNGLPPPPPAALPSFNIAVQADSEEQPVSFDDLPTSAHLISSTNKHRAKIPTRRRPTGSRGKHSNGQQVTNGNGHSDISAENGNSQDRLALPSEENDYDGDESEMSYSQIKRGHRRSLKRRQPQPTKSSAIFIPGNRISDSDDKEIVHSKHCDDSQKALSGDIQRKQRDSERLENEKKLEAERREQERALAEKLASEKEKAERREQIAREKASEDEKLEKARLAEEKKIKAEAVKKKEEEEQKRLGKKTNRGPETSRGTKTF